MIDYTISDSVKLPSLGKVYGKEVPEQVRLKSMTTQHEMMRLSHSEYAYKNLCDIIDDCIIEPIGISAYDFCLGDYQAVLYKLRSVTYGPEYQLSSVCPYCGEVTTGTVNLDELKTLEYSEDFENAKIIVLPKSKKTVELRLQSPRTLDVITQNIKQFKKDNPKALDPTIIYTLAGNISMVDGKVYSFVDMDKWLRELPAYDMNFLMSKIDNLNSMIGVDTTLTNTCGICGLEFTTNLKINSEFFRPSLN